MNSNILKDVAKLLGQIGWDNKLKELDEQAILYLIMKIQQLEDIGNDVNDVGDKNAEFPFGKNKEQDSRIN